MRPCSGTSYITFVICAALWICGAALAAEGVLDRFQRAFDRGASCSQLFAIRNEAYGKYPPIINKMLGSVGCYSPESKRMTPSESYSYYYKIAYTVCSHNPSQTYKEAGTNDPSSAARWLAEGDWGESYKGTYDGCLTALLGKPGRFTLPSPPSPFVGAEDKLVSQITGALRKAGFSICKQLDFPGPNRGYGHVGVRSYDVAVGICPSSRPRVERNPVFASINVEKYTTTTERVKGSNVHRNEVINGRHISGAAWAYHNLFVELPIYIHRDIALRVKAAMSESPGAEPLYFRFE